MGSHTAGEKSRIMPPNWSLYSHLSLLHKYKKNVGYIGNVIFTIENKLIKVMNNAQNNSVYRSLGVWEYLLWLYDQVSTTHFSLVAQIMITPLMQR